MSYVEEIAGLFRSRCNDAKILHSMDYVIIAEWEKQEIPVAIVATAINRICDELGDEALRIESVGHFQETIKQNFRAWLQTQVR